jgi:glucuronokinase
VPPPKGDEFPRARVATKLIAPECCCGVTIVEVCPARAAIAGNPSDGFGGAVVSTPVRSCGASVTVTPSSTFAISHSASLDDTFASFAELTRHVDRYGFTGSRELVLATLRRFVHHTAVEPAPCRIDVATTIPRSVGLAGSSAIIIATLRAMFEHTTQPLPAPDELASLALSVEVDELGYAAGLQDRVVQAYDRTTYMQFGDGFRREVNGLAAGTYTTLEADLPGELFVAYRSNDAEPSQSVHGDLRRRFDIGDPTVCTAMTDLAELAASAADSISRGDGPGLATAIDATFDVRQSMMDLRPGHVEMVVNARVAGASANFAGSGGAVIVFALDPAVADAARRSLRAIECDILELPANA